MADWNETTLRSAASWKAFKEGKSLFENGAVTVAKKDGDSWSGTVRDGKRLLKAAGHQVPGSRPILEVHPQHPLVQRLKEEIGKELEDNAVWIWTYTGKLFVATSKDTKGFTPRTGADLGTLWKAAPAQ